MLLPEGLRENAEEKKKTGIRKPKPCQDPFSSPLSHPPKHGPRWQGALLKASTMGLTTLLHAHRAEWPPRLPPRGKSRLVFPNYPLSQPRGRGTRLTLGGPASVLVAHALQRGEGHVEIAVGTGPEAPQAVAVEIRVRLPGYEGRRGCSETPGEGGKGWGRKDRRRIYSQPSSCR